MELELILGGLGGGAYLGLDYLYARSINKMTNSIKYTSLRYSEEGSDVLKEVGTKFGAMGPLSYFAHKRYMSLFK